LVIGIRQGLGRGERQGGREGDALCRAATRFLSSRLNIHDPVKGGEGKDRVIVESYRLSIC